MPTTITSPLRHATRKVARRMPGLSSNPLGQVLSTWKHFVVTNFGQIGTFCFFADKSFFVLSFSIPTDFFFFCFFSRKASKWFPPSELELSFRPVWNLISLRGFERARLIFDQIFFGCRYPISIVGRERERERERDEENCWICCWAVALAQAVDLWIMVLQDLGSIIK